MLFFRKEGGRKNRQQKNYLMNCSAQKAKKNSIIEHYFLNRN
jgi:hypothetical protein